MTDESSLLRLGIVDLRQTCSACPSQWEARTPDGRYVYIRYRWGRLSVGVGQTPEQAVDGRHFGLMHGDEMAGVMSTNEMLRHTGLIEIESVS